MARALTFPQFARLSGRHIRGVKFLYAFECSNGIVKVGRSFAPRQRLTSHQRQLLRDGVRIVKFAACPTTSDSYVAEQELIARMRRVSTVKSGNEWFTGVRFGVAATLLKQIASRQFVQARAI